MRDQYHRKEVQAFIIASEQLYKLFSEGHPLNVCEAEAVLCCLDELLAQGKSAIPHTLSRVARFRVHWTLYE